MEPVIKDASSGGVTSELRLTRNIRGRGEKGKGGGGMITGKQPQQN